MPGAVETGFFPAPMSPQRLPIVVSVRTNPSISTFKPKLGQANKFSDSMLIDALAER